MIDFSICPDAPIRSGWDQRGRTLVTNWLVSVQSVAANQDSSGGQIAAALNSGTRLFVTSYQYEACGGTFTCLNVMVDRRDYRLFVGFDDKVIRVEALDARAARGQTRLEARRWSPSDAADWQTPQSMANKAIVFFS